MKAFDLERAKTGEPIVYPTGDGWKAAEFIADWNDHDVVCRVPGFHYPIALSKAALRMARKKFTWYCLLVDDGNGIPALLRHRVEPNWAHDLKRLGVPFTVEVEE